VYVALALHILSLQGTKALFLVGFLGEIKKSEIKIFEYFFFSLW